VRRLLSHKQFLRCAQNDSAVFDMGEALVAASEL